MQLRFTKRARTEFLRIVDVYAEYAGQRSADRFIDKMRKCSEEILKYPVWIDDIWDGRRNPAKLVKRI